MGPQVPFVDPVTGPERVEFSYTSKQRAWWLRAYTNDHGIPQCGFEQYTDDRWQRCKVAVPEGKGLEAHHLVPSAWTIEQTPWLDPNDPLTTPALLVCRPHHHFFHPDVKAVFDSYWKVEPEKRKDLFKNAIHKHHELARQGIIFWEGSYDEIFKAIAYEAMQKYMKENPSDLYPRDNSWTKKPHPKKPHWGDGLF